MADPLSLAAIAALVYSGRKLSEDREKSTGDNTQPVTKPMPTRTVEPIPEIPLPDKPAVYSSKQEMPSFGDVAFMKHVNGEPVREDFRDRPYVSGQMNNLSPVQKQLVGPGLGVGADVPAYGGYQQLYRVNPTNVGAYKLTTLPGRTGPAVDVTGGKSGVVGELTHFKPTTTAFLPCRLPPTPGSAQGQGGAVKGMTYRGEYEKTKRMTNRAENTKRCDGLEFAPAKYFVSAEQLAQDPTRNKGDMNVQEFFHVNNPEPGIANFVGGYTDAPGSRLMAEAKGANGYTTEQLEKYGFRPDENRGKADRNGNAGRMNVRGDPLNQGGVLSQVRTDCSRVDGRMNAANGGWSQNYIQSDYYQLNSYKGMADPHGSNNYLNTAKKVLANNPLAQSISA